MVILRQIHIAFGTLYTIMFKTQDSLHTFKSHLKIDLFAVVIGRYYCKSLLHTSSACGSLRPYSDFVSAINVHYITLGIHWLAVKCT